ncbi:uncharacterized protein LTR77_006871 [Saxophila tyrrhenica]|uniref:Amino acid transporter n=1 Tax=Saxophila tyrrhenica TaxID=1690608 RepID=A0AAV9P658_9PEZI|nr:hypothetical protein LTR77_006871 [Saxophila tyrrhenica]
MAGLMPRSSGEPVDKPVAYAHQVRAAHSGEDEMGVAEVMVSEKWQGTDVDRRDMSQLGKVQELRRNFHFLSILGFACCLVATWEVLLTTIITSLTDGGTAGLLWGFLIVVAGFYFVYLSLAEMASMAPTAGGQYHWSESRPSRIQTYTDLHSARVSEFAPPRAQKFLSYIVGWLCFTGWQGAICAICFITGTIIQGLIILNDDTYIPKSWHGTLLTMAVAAFAVVFNTVLAKKLPLVEFLLLVLHVIGFIAIIAVLWALAPRATAHDAWFQFSNAGGWNSAGTATMVGLLSPVISTIGFDCAVHMAEEVKDSSSTLPKALLWSFTFNAVLGFIMAVTLVYTLGNVNEVLGSLTGYPFIQIFYNTTQSYTGANIMTLVVILTLTSSAIAEVATASRQIWSFARDKGVPGYRWVAHISPGWNIPLNAVLLSLLVTSLLSLINIGSYVALNAILALTAVSLLTSYIIVISCLILKRLRGQPLPARRWSLGKWGLPINIIALCYLLPIYVFSFFPVALVELSAASMNWAIVIYVGIMGFATIYYFVYGHKVYLPPVALVKREEFGR